MTVKPKTAPSRESFVRRHRPFFVGLFIIIPLSAIPILLSYTLMTSEVFKQWSRFHVVYDQSYGLSKGNAVTISGMSIGYVEEVSLVREGAIAVRFKIDREYHSFVKSDTRALVKQKNLVVGDWEIQLTGGGDDAPFASEGDTLLAEYGLRLDQLTGQIAGTVSRVRDIADSIAAGRGNLGMILMGDGIVTRMESILTNVNDITLESMAMMKRAETLLETINEAGADGAAIAASGVAIADSVKTLMAALGPMLKSSRVIVENVEKVSHEAVPLMTQVNDNLNQVEAMMRGLQNNWFIRRAVGETDDPMLKE